MKSCFVVVSGLTLVCAAFFTAVIAPQGISAAWLNNPPRATQPPRPTATRRPTQAPQATKTHRPTQPPGHQPTPNTPTPRTTPTLVPTFYNGLAVGENIAVGMDSATAVVNAWSNEVPPNDVQRQTLVNCDFKDIGVGYFFLANDTGTENHQQYWTVLLAK